MNMMTINEYIKLMLKKKKMSNMDLVRAINKVEEASGVSERTVRQNVCNYLNGYWNYGYDVARKTELALDLEDGTLMQLTPKPNSKAEKEHYKETMKKWKK